MQRLEALVLAAGLGRRFGGGKLTAPWNGGVLLDGALAAAFAAPARSVTLVTGADADRVAAAARAWADRAGQPDRLAVAHAPAFAEGLGASLRTGAAVLPADAAGVFIFLGDMPRVPTAVLQSLADAVLAGAPAAAPQFAGRRGNPVLLGAALIPALDALTGDQGAREILRRLGDRLALVEAPDDGVLFDVDLPEHLSSA
ncbi:nucleotidyltransferase family protein [Phenylobacterium sp.]|jgi:molybdenum cofactor cytidylyltransferase|uniref:nucleotidyltransferase family protein n=1 Tax=Phenylobacterium sp. TaxID=1871053 RepID=UPI002F429E7A